MIIKPVTPPFCLSVKVKHNLRYWITSLNLVTVYLQLASSIGAEDPDIRPGKASETNFLVIPLYTPPSFLSFINKTNSASSG